MTLRAIVLHPRLLLLSVLLGCARAAEPPPDPRAPTPEDVAGLPVRVRTPLELPEPEPAPSVDVRASDAVLARQLLEVSPWGGGRAVNRRLNSAPEGIVQAVGDLYADRSFLAIAEDLAERRRLLHAMELLRGLPSARASDLLGEWYVRAKEEEEARDARSPRAYAGNENRPWMLFLEYMRHARSARALRHVDARVLTQDFMGLQAMLGWLAEAYPGDPAAIAIAAKVEEQRGLADSERAIFEMRARFIRGEARAGE